MASILADMKKGVAPSRATLAGTDDFTLRVVSCLPHYIPREVTATGVLHGVPALKHRLQRLQKRLPGVVAQPAADDDAAAAAATAQPAEPLTLADVEPLSVWRFWLDDDQKEEVSEMIDKIVKANSTVSLGSFSDKRRTKRGGAGMASNEDGAAASSTFAGEHGDSGLFD